MAIADSAKFDVAHEPDLLGGVTVIRGTSPDAAGKPFDFMAIPYHAWANRGATKMTVWVDRLAD